MLPKRAIRYYKCRFMDVFYIIYDEHPPANSEIFSLRRQIGIEIIPIGNMGLRRLQQTVIELIGVQAIRGTNLIDSLEHCVPHLYQPRSISIRNIQREGQIEQQKEQ